MFSIVGKPFIFLKAFNKLLKLIVGILKVAYFLALTIDSAPHFIKTNFFFLPPGLHVLPSILVNHFCREATSSSTS